MKLLASVILCLCSFATLATELNLKPTKAGLYDVGGFKLYLECYENDKPQLILEQGFGRAGSDGVWLENIDRLKNDYSVCLYDRAGIGKSEKGPVPFTVNDMATRLNKLLAAADVKAPFYFAGGSYASYIISAYNNLYPQEVLGAVLIDPPVFGYFYTMGTRWPENFKSDDENLQRFYNFEQSVHDPMFKKVPENVDHMKSYKILSNAANFGDKPIITVRSKQTDKRYDPPFVPDEIAKSMDLLEAGAEAYFKSLSTKSRIVYSESEKHHLHIADRDLVVKSIKALTNDSSSLVAKEFDLEKFARHYFKLMTETQKPNATSKELESYLSLLTDDIGHSHLPYVVDDSRLPDGKASMRKGMTFYLGAHDKYEATLLDVFVFNNSAIAIRYKNYAKGVHPQNNQPIEYSQTMMEVLELEGDKVAVIRKYHE